MNEQYDQVPQNQQLQDPRMQGGMPSQPQSQTSQALQMQDPFAMGRYQHVNLPDVPISYNGGMAEQLLNDNEVPDEIRKKHWFVFHRDNVLTFLDQERKDSKLLNFDIIKIDILNKTPYYDYSFDMELEMSIMRNVFETKLDRAFGFTGQAQRNERIVLQSQFSEQRMINDNDKGNVHEGFFKRLLGRRG